MVIDGKSLIFTNGRGQVVHKLQTDCGMIKAKVVNRHDGVPLVFDVARCGVVGPDRSFVRRWQAFVQIYNRSDELRAMVRLIRYRANRCYEEIQQMFDEGVVMFNDGAGSYGTEVCDRGSMRMLAEWGVRFDLNETGQMCEFDSDQKFVRKRPDVTLPRTYGTCGGQELATITHIVAWGRFMQHVTKSAFDGDYAWKDLVKRLRYATTLKFRKPFDALTESLEKIGYRECVYEHLTNSFGGLAFARWIEEILGHALYFEYTNDCEPKDYIFNPLGLFPKAKNEGVEYDDPTPEVPIYSDEEKLHGGAEADNKHDLRTGEWTGHAKFLEISSPLVDAMYDAGVLYDYRIGLGVRRFMNEKGYVYSPMLRFIPPGIREVEFNGMPVGRKVIFNEKEYRARTFKDYWSWLMRRAIREKGCSTYGEILPYG
jgi:hypothetical protein